MKSVISDAMRDITTFFHIKEFPSIQYLKKKECPYLQKRPNVSGFYNSTTNLIVLNKTIAKDLSKKKQYKLVYHELGHYIHDKYFAYQPQYLQRKHHGNRDYYCNLNQKESFACCFADYMWCRKQNKIGKIQNSARLKKMDTLLTTHLFI